LAVSGNYLILILVGKPTNVPLFLKIEHMILVVDMSLHLRVATTLEIAHHASQFAVLRFSFFFLRTHDTLVQSLTDDFWTFIQDIALLILPFSCNISNFAYNK